MAARLTGVILLLVSVVFQTAVAQPTLTLKRIINNWPTIELYLGVVCEGKATYDMEMSHFAVYENGEEIRDFTFWCPDPHPRVPVSLALVFAASGADSAVVEQMKLAATRLVARMDGGPDEVCVLVGDSTIAPLQTMTTSKALLTTAIAGWAPAASTPLLDVCYLGIKEIERNATQYGRSLVLFTNGRDSGSVRDGGDLTTLAWRLHMRIYIVTFGDGKNDDLTELELQFPGNTVHEPHPGQISGLFEEMSTWWIGDCFNEPLITYEASCMDGSRRVVDLALKDFCGGSDLRTKTYQAPRDTAYFGISTSAWGAPWCRPEGVW